MHALPKSPRQHSLVPFPKKLEDGTEFEVAMMLLSADEVYTVKTEAEKQVKAKLGGALPKRDEFSKAYFELYNDFQTLNTVFLSCRNPFNLQKPFFPNRDAITKILTNDENRPACRPLHDAPAKGPERCQPRRRPAPVLD